MRSAVSPVASLMIMTVFMCERSIARTARAFGIRSRGIPAHMRAHDLAAAATQRMVLARRARLGDASRHVRNAPNAPGCVQ